MRPFIIIALIVAIVVLVLWLFHSQPIGEPVSEVVQAASIPFTGFHQLLAPKGEVSYKVQIKGGPFEPGDPRWKEWDMFLKIDPNFEWKMPISFYGEVIDQYGIPVEGAKAEFVISDTSLHGTTHVQIYTDLDGKFSITGKTGKGMSVTISKEGYDTPHTEKLSSFEYASFYQQDFYEPDPSKPIIFHLHKRGAAEPLIVREKLYFFNPTGALRYINLKTGRALDTPSQGDDLIIKFTRSNQNSRGDSQTWNAQISVPSGGLIPSDQEFMTEAPESGYQQEINLGSEQHIREWTDQKYYIVSGNPPIYGTVDFQLEPDYHEDSAIKIISRVNPSGSRNLEYDPTMVIKN